MLSKFREVSLKPVVCLRQSRRIVHHKRRIFGGCICARRKCDSTRTIRFLTRNQRPFLCILVRPTRHYISVCKFCYSPLSKGTGAKMRPAIVFGIVTGDVPVSYWPIFSLFLITVPEVFANVKSVQFPSHF